MLKIYNTLTRRVEEIKPIKTGEITMYTCGPTVYSHAHIGNMSAYLMADLIRRVLELGGNEVKHVKNITDVGHLSTDADEGEDKMEKAAKREGKTVLEIAREYEAIYIADEQKLRLREPMARPRATDYIQEQIDFIKVLEEKGYTYCTSDGVYFSIEKFPDYGQLSGNTVDQLQAGARIEVNAEKKHPADFALWKFCVRDNSQHELRWDAPFVPTGESADTFPGFPGWHIECSVMAAKLLGDTYDIKTGGEDNIFPHHECEIAQSFGVTGKPLANYFVHKRFILMDDEKMAKSVGNVLTLSDIEVQGFSVLDFRYLLLSVSYRDQLSFTIETLESARNSRKRLNEFHLRLTTYEALGDSELESEIEKLQTKLLANLENDLNTSGALAAAFEILKIGNKSMDEGSLSSADQTAIQKFLTDFDQVFDIFEIATEVPSEVSQLAEARVKARAEQNWSESDRLRDEITALGWEVRDSGTTYDLKKA